MLKIENFEVLGWEHAIRGMRNPKNSWEKSDSDFQARRDLYYRDPEVMSFVDEDGNLFMMDGVDIGPNDHDLMTRLAAGGPVHAKYRRMITVYLDITAPLYWWKEYDTYKVGTVANSCSTMHKIHEKEFTLDDFSHEQLIDGHDIIENKALEDNLDILEKYQLEGQILANGEHDLMVVESEDRIEYLSPTDILEVYVISALNLYRDLYLKTKDKKYWWQMIQLLPSSYNQKRTVMLNYEVLANIYRWRRDHKLDEWHTFCDWIEGLPYSELITGVAK